jgi:PII-like signaling protein
MNEDCLKLTTYFGERDRTDSRLLADELLDLYGRHEIQTSILLRGIEGFGFKHQVHTDMLLSLSEDLPVVSVAVDTRTRIEALLDDVMNVKRKGLLTLERARMLTAEIAPVTLPEELHEATKLTVYVGRQERVHREAAFAAVCDLLHRRGIAGATAFLGVDGTSHGVRARAKFFGRNAEVPMMIIAVGAGEQIGRVLPELGELVRRPMVTLERVRLCKRDGELLAVPEPLPGIDEHGLAMWQKLMIYSSEAAEHSGRPLHRALVRELREHSDTRGATSIRGVWGFHGEHPPHGDRLLQLRRHVPVVTIVVDTPERIAAAFEIVDDLTAQTGLVTSEMVPAATAIHDDERRGGLRLARHRF